MAKGNYLWWVQCEGYPDVPVLAPDWEQATVQAAKLWCVPWAKVAALCELREKLPAITCVYQRCQRVCHGTGTLCDDCVSAVRIEAQRTEAAKRRYFRKLYAGK